MDRYLRSVRGSRVKYVDWNAPAPGAIDQDFVYVKGENRVIRSRSADL